MKKQLKIAAVIAGFLAIAAGALAAQDYRYNERDDDRYDRGYYDDRGYHDDRGYYDYDGRENFRYAMRVAREFGYRDGAQVAREDRWLGKPFNPNPRGRFDDDDHGYRRSFGNKHEYREHYAAAYREAYSRNYGGYDYYR